MPTITPEVNDEVSLSLYYRPSGAPGTSMRPGQTLLVVGKIIEVGDLVTVRVATEPYSIELAVPRSELEWTSSSRQWSVVLAQPEGASGGGGGDGVVAVHYVTIPEGIKNVRVSSVLKPSTGTKFG